MLCDGEYLFLLLPLQSTDEMSSSSLLGDFCLLLLFIFSPHSVSGPLFVGVLWFFGFSIGRNHLALVTQFTWPYVVIVRFCNFFFTGVQCTNDTKLILNVQTVLSFSSFRVQSDAYGWSLWVLGLQAYALVPGADKRTSSVSTCVRVVRGDYPIILLSSSACSLRP